MRRRDFIALLGGAAVMSSSIWPLAARAQQPDRMRRIGAFIGTAADDPLSQVVVAEFLRGLQDLGWTVGRNVAIDWRWFSVDAGRMRTDAAELVALAPDVLVTTSGPTLTALLGVTRAVPIVFTNVLDPVGAGFVASLARPGGNITGFASADFSTAAKWLELLKEIAPRVKRVVVARTAAIGGGSQFGAIQGVAPALGVELHPLDPSDPGEIERTLAAFVREPNGGGATNKPSMVATKPLASFVFCGS
jgi:putative ABC transport system substrate-binding protein